MAFETMGDVKRYLDTLLYAVRRAICVKSVKSVQSVEEIALELMLMFVVAVARITHFTLL